MGMPPVNLANTAASPAFTPSLPGAGNVLGGGKPAFPGPFGPFGGSPFPMIFPPAPAGPAPTLLGFRPVYSNDVFTPGAAPAAPAAAPEAATPAASEAPETAASAGKTSNPAATAAAPASYEEELGDRVTTILKRNPQLSNKIQAWETDLEAKGLDLETLAENPDQLAQELLANPNSVVNQQLDEFKQTRTYKMVHAVYKMVPGPIKKLMIKALPNKYEAMAEQLEDTLFNQPPSSTASASGPEKSASGSDSLSLNEEPASPSSSRRRGQRSHDSHARSSSSSSMLDDALGSLGSDSVSGEPAL